MGRKTATYFIGDSLQSALMLQFMTMMTLKIAGGVGVAVGDAEVEVWCWCCSW
jgi:predicted alpha/beta hydrolase family esterase